MNLYAALASNVDTNEARDLTMRLSAWHDAMVAHERRLRVRDRTAVCDEDCPHSEARVLWAEAIAVFGDRAEELVFLRTRANAPAHGLPPPAADRPAAGA